MKTSILTTAIVAAFLSACDKKEAAKPAPAAAKMEAQSQDVARSEKPEFAAPDSFKAGIGKVYAGYLQIESALAQDDFPGAKSAFETMHVALHTLPKDGLDSLARIQWDSLDGRMMMVLHPMAASKDIGAMRNNLGDFTPLMLDAIEKFGVAGSDPVFLFHCPMAKNGQGADWLQKDNSVRNPFYGKAMPQCGSLKKEVRI